MRLIDADELKTAFPCGEYVRTESVRATIDHMPSAEPRNKGKWIEKSTNGEMFSSCSVCGYIEWDAPRNFCPNCGADMTGGEEE